MAVVKILPRPADLVDQVVDQNMMIALLLGVQVLVLTIQDHHQTLHHPLVGVIRVVLVVLAALAVAVVLDLLEVILLGLLIILVVLVELEYKFHQHSIIHPILEWDSLVLLELDGLLVVAVVPHMVIPTLAVVVAVVAQQEIQTLDTLVLVMDKRIILQAIPYNHENMETPEQTLDQVEVATITVD